MLGIAPPLSSLVLLPHWYWDEKQELSPWDPDVCNIEGMDGLSERYMGYCAQGTRESMRGPDVNLLLNEMFTVPHLQLCSFANIQYSCDWNTTS